MNPLWFVNNRLCLFKRREVAYALTKAYVDIPSLPFSGVWFRSPSMVSYVQVLYHLAIAGPEDVTHIQTPHPISRPAVSAGTRSGGTG